MNGCLTLTTDFGLRDPWVAEVKGAVMSVWDRYPGFDGRIFDMGHELPPGDVPAAGWFLRRAVSCWPTGTVHVVVVDPGVGTERPAVACTTGGSAFVGPGNGLLSFLAGRDDLEVVVLDKSLYMGSTGNRHVSCTFHGRDVFAPVAAHLAAGVPLRQVGTPVGPGALGAIPGDASPGETVRIVWIDRFGNAVTDLSRDQGLARRVESVGRVLVGGRSIRGPEQAYGLASPGVPFWYWGSGDTLEIAMRDRSAAKFLGLEVGLVLEVPEA